MTPANIYQARDRKSQTRTLAPDTCAAKQFCLYHSRPASPNARRACPYQFTHDVSLEPELPVRLRYPQDHAARGLIQLVLLAVWWDLATLPLA